MNKEDDQNDYFELLCDLVCGKRFSKNISFRKLLMFLHNTEFRYSMEMDSNRFKDGVDLRRRYTKSNGIDDRLCIADKNGDRAYTQQDDSQIGKKRFCRCDRGYRRNDRHGGAVDKGQAQRQRQRNGLFRRGARTALLCGGCRWDHGGAERQILQLCSDHGSDRAGDSIEIPRA